MIRVRRAGPEDAGAWLRMRHDLWPDGTREEHRADIDAFLAGTAAEPAEVLVAEAEDGELVGLAELSIRPCAEGCRTRSVAYLEGWYVAPDHRKKGVGRALIEAAEAWGRSRGCTEFASDAQSGNGRSIAAHLALGFEDAGLVRCFKKEL